MPSNGLLSTSKFVCFWKGWQVWIAQSEVIKDFRVLSTFKNQQIKNGSLLHSQPLLGTFHLIILNKKALRTMKVQTEELEMTVNFFI